MKGAPKTVENVACGAVRAAARLPATRAVVAREEMIRPRSAVSPSVIAGCGRNAEWCCVRRR